MRLAVMQPYLFPYLGYYQLIGMADIFVIYDDVTYIKGGYINRNSILVKGNAQRFTVPVVNASSNNLIKQVSFSDHVGKTLKTISQAYSRAPNFHNIFPIIEAVLCFPQRDVPSICRQSMTMIMEYIGLPFDIRHSSELHYDRSLSAPDKLIAMCQLFGATEYINSAGGQDLYEKSYFSDHGVCLLFTKMRPAHYHQHQPEFIPNLSIIDVLMWCSRDEIVHLLDQYDLI